MAGRARSDLMEISRATYLQSFITISNEFLVQRHRILESSRILRDQTERSARACAQRRTDLLHLGIEVSVTVGNNELDGFIGYLFIRAFHGDAPDKIHPCQVQTFHTLKNKTVMKTMMFASLHQDAEQNNQTHQLSPLAFEPMVTQVNVLKEGLKQVETYKHIYC